VPDRIDDEQGRRLLALAREAIRAELLGLPAPEPAAGEPRRAVFVTLRRREDGSLRGCIGHVEARHPLGEAVARAAVLAATRDPRFPPVEASELEALQIEISVLSPFDPAPPEAVEPGVHGVLVSWRGSRGLLLPQVAREQGWDRETLLDHACLKAGAPAGAWRDAETSLRIFTAVSVCEP